MIKKFQFKKIKDLISGSSIIFVAICVGFLSLEPTISSAIEDQFTVTQSVTAEISIYSPASNVTMSGSIAGISGGTATGQTQVVILTNNNTGYTMTVVASNTPAMRGNGYSGTITDYAPASTGIPDYSFVAPTSGNSKFGFSVSASTTADLAQKFKDNGSSTCNTGSTDTSASTSCWMGLSTTATSTMVTSSYTPNSGSTSTLFFKVQIASNSNVIEDTYVATATLTATMN